ncbi:hypothetical protein [Sphingomicrobium marinum]|uniref:hypothetical protein n=1 Tax=Sphingomicrobium marinum TaxID=1227950 RepID=UPI00223FA3EB|nr:hypothetical protein [Sphingomicrobium marinum]
MTCKLLIAGITLPLVAAACAPVDPGYGDAVAYNKAAHTIDPEPEYEWDDAKPGESGERGADNAKAYREGTVKRPSGAGGSGGNQGGTGGGGQGGLGSRQSSGPL